jgi:hypothetical protein
MEAVYEQFFFLKYSGGWSFSEAYNLPVGLRVWFVERLIKQLKMEKEAAENSHAQQGSGGGSRQTLNASNQPQAPKSLIPS